MKFLIVEDSRPTRNLIKNYIDEIKFEGKFDGKTEYYEAEDGEGALDIIKTRYVDFVTLDWNLSTKMTGLDVLKTIRSMDICKNVPVIMTTGESDKANVIEAIKCGASDFASKPIDKKSFSEKILKALSNAKQ